MLSVGFVGLGVMGSAMARNLLKAGFRLKVYDKDQQRVQALADEGASAAASAAEAADGADFTVTMLPNGDDVKAAVLGAQGIAGTLAEAAVHIDSSTIAPRDSLAVHEALAARGRRMIDAPVGGQSTHAVAGTLLFMAGGDAAAIAQAKPLFDAMGSQLVHCGGNAMGATMKVVNNYMGAVLGVLTAETLTLAEKAGLELDVALDVLKQTAAGKGLLNIWSNTVLKGNVRPGFMLDLSHKDLGLGLDLAAAHGVPAATGAVARQMQSVARAMGRGRDDASVIYEVIRTLSTRPD